MKGVWKDSEGYLYEVLCSVKNEDGKEYVLYKGYNEEYYGVGTPITFVALDVQNNEEFLIERYKGEFYSTNIGKGLSDVEYKYFILEKDIFLSKVLSDGVEVDRFTKVK